MNQMAITLAKILINLLRLYFISGLIFVVPFVLFGVQKLDRAAQWEMKLGRIVKGIIFRCLITPGLCAFWPLFALRLLRGKGVPTERNAHRQLAKQN